MTRKIRTFQLYREEDVSGVSGTGFIAEGVVLHDGHIILSWYGDIPTEERLSKLEDVLKIHGHGGKTTIVWDE